MKQTIYLDHTKLFRFEELALKIANSIDCHCGIEININREKTRAFVNINLMDYDTGKIESMFFIPDEEFKEFKELALEIARESNVSVRIDVQINAAKTKAQANILLLGILDEKNKKKT